MHIDSSPVGGSKAPLIWLLAQRIDVSGQKKKFDELLTFTGIIKTFLTVSNIILKNVI